MLRGVEFEWDEWNLDKVARHRIDPEECEECLADPRRVVEPVPAQ